MKKQCPFTLAREARKSMNHPAKFFHRDRHNNSDISTSCKTHTFLFINNGLFFKIKKIKQTGNVQGFKILCFPGCSGMESLAIKQESIQYKGQSKLE